MCAGVQHGLSGGFTAEIRPLAKGGTERAAPETSSKRGIEGI